MKTPSRAWHGGGFYIALVLGFEGLGSIVQVPEHMEIRNAFERVPGLFYNSAKQGVYRPNHGPQRRMSGNGQAWQVSVFLESSARSA